MGSSWSALWPPCWRNPAGEKFKRKYHERNSDNIITLDVFWAYSSKLDKKARWVKDGNIYTAQV